MDKHEESLKFKEHKPIDHVGIAKTLISSYPNSLIQFVDRSENELDESDFVREQIAKHTQLLLPHNQFTVGVKWQAFMKHTKNYLKFLLERDCIISRETSKEEKSKKVTAYVKIYSLKRFAPELNKKIVKLSKNDKCEIINLLTGVDPVSAYIIFNRLEETPDWINVVKDSVSNRDFKDRIDLIEKKME